MRRLIVLLATVLPLFVLAQLNGSLIISGKIISEQNLPVVGASVTVKGTDKGVITSADGSFSLVTNQKFPFRIVVSSVGFAPQELEVKSQDSKLNIQLV
jgi:hypothetical protein